MSLKEWIQESNNIVFFGGAGVSTESNIPDFRVITDYIKRNIHIQLKLCCRIVFILVIRKNFLNFILTK